MQLLLGCAPPLQLLVPHDLLPQLLLLLDLQPVVASLLVLVAGLQGQEGVRLKATRSENQKAPTTTRLPVSEVLPRGSPEKGLRVPEPGDPLRLRFGGAAPPPPLDVPPPVAGPLPALAPPLFSSRSRLAARRKLRFPGARFAPYRSRSRSRSRSLSRSLSRSRSRSLSRSERLTGE